MAKLVDFPGPGPGGRVNEARQRAFLVRHYGAPGEMDGAEVIVKARLGQLPGVDLMTLVWPLALGLADQARRAGVVIRGRGPAGNLGAAVALADAILGSIDKAAGLRPGPAARE